MSIETYKDEPFSSPWLEPVSCLVSVPDGSSVQVELPMALKIQYSFLVKMNRLFELKALGLKMSKATGMPYVDCLPFAICKLVGPVDPVKIQEIQNK